MTERPSPSLPRSGTTLHHAIDQLTAVTIDLQHFRRQQRNAPLPDARHVGEALTQIEDRLHELARLLLALRNESTPDAPALADSRTPTHQRQESSAD
jgi:hypothetical protein